MSTPEDFKLNPPKFVLYLPTPADLAASSFEWAREILKEKGDLPLILLVPPSQGGAQFYSWLWDHSRVTSVCDIPKEILSDPDAWAVYGYRYVVVSIAPPTT